jgi:hypothetical protein
MWAPVPRAGEEQTAECRRGLTSIDEVRWRTSIEPNRDLGGYSINVNNSSPPAERTGAESLVSTAGHRKALLETEIRCLVRTLRSYGVLTERQLEELSGARHWHHDRLRQALEEGVQRGVLRRPGAGFVELPPDLW